MVIKNFKLISNFKLKISNSRGITLIEIVVAIFIIALFSMILISDFPKIQRQFALSRATYKLAQDLRKTEDLGLSGVTINDSQGSPIAVMGYGLYIDLAQSTTKYLIYADVKPNSTTPSNNIYVGTFSTLLCSAQVDPTSDCIVEIVDVSKENPSLYIGQPNNINGNKTTSINFRPPGPIININNLKNPYSQVGIVLGNGLTTRTVWVNTSGLINVQ